MKKTIVFLFVLFVLSITAVAQAHSVVLTWSPSTDGAANASSGYNVLRGTTSGGESSTPINSAAVAVGCTNTTTCTYTDTSSAVVAGATLYYEVTFVVGTTSSAPSNQASGTVPVAAPTGLTATAN
jgi:hypothetical protein